MTKILRLARLDQERETMNHRVLFRQETTLSLSLCTSTLCLLPSLSVHQLSVSQTTNFEATFKRDRITIKHD